MKMNCCESALIAAHGHDPETNTLRLEFKNGTQHDYANFTAEHYADLTGAESLGKYFHANLRKSEKHPSTLAKP